MKKTLSVLLSICLMLAVCVPAFAEVDLSSTGETVQKVTDTVKSLTDESDESAINEAAEKVLDILKKAGAKTREEAQGASDQLYNDTVIDKNVYKALNDLIAQDSSFEEATNSTNSIIDEVRAILEDDSLSTTDKVSKVASKLAGLPMDEVKKILDDLHAQGTIDDDMYSKISDAINNLSIDNISNLIPGGESGGGIGDLLGGLTGGGGGGILDTILGLFGMGGGGDEGGSSNGGSSSSGSSSSNTGSSTSFQGKTAKTGDYAAASIAAVAALAGVAFVLTRKKIDK